MKKLPYIIAILLFASCDSEDAWDMLKTRGDRKVEVRELTAYTGITVHNGINVVLEKSDKHEAILDGWSNLMPKVKLSIDSDGMLTIKDENKFDIVRNPANKTTIHLYYNGDINCIASRSDGLITNIDTLYAGDLIILSEDASGSIELVVKASSVGFGSSSYNVGDVKLKGASSSLEITCRGTAPVDARELEVRTCNISHRGTGDLYVNVANTLVAGIHSIGDIYYKGSPTITSSGKGKGKLYPFL